MSSRIYRKSSGLICALVLTAAVAGCGGNPPPANNAPTPMSEIQRQQNALPLAQAERIPKGLHCRSPIVWVNLNTKVYHEKGSPYYGRTRHGQYMCQAAANAAGDHIAGTRRGSMDGARRNGNRQRTSTTSGNE